MGMLAVTELAQKVEAGTMSLRDALHRHLATGFVNPIPEEWIPVCMGIIERYQGGDRELYYDIPVPGKPDSLVAESITEDLHLEPFMEIAE